MRLASLCYRALQRLRITAFARRLSSRALVLCYHNVTPTDDPTSRDSLGLHMPLSTFARQMRWLARTYNVVPLAELVNCVANSSPRQRLAAVTFDDGYQGFFEFAWPLLKKLGIPATVFLVGNAPFGEEVFWWESPEVRRAYSPSRLENWLTAQGGDGETILATLERNSLPADPVPVYKKPAAWQTIAAAAKDGLQLGAHSLSHRSLSNLDDHELKQELVASRDVIRKHTGVTAEFFAYPYGLWNGRVRDAVCRAGYRAAFTLDYSDGSSTTDPWALPRLNVPASISDPAFQAWTAGLNLRGRRGV